METKSHSFFYRHRNLLSSQRGNITHGVIFLLIFGNLLRIDDKHACSGAPARTKLTKWDVDQSSTPVTSSSSRLDHSAMRIFALWLLLFWKKNMTICACCCRTFFSHHEVVLLHRPEPRMHCASIWLGDAACIRLQSNPFYSHWTARNNRMWPAKLGRACEHLSNHAVREYHGIYDNIFWEKSIQQ
jgi:hypothetical protein